MVLRERAYVRMVRAVLGTCADAAVKRVVPWAKEEPQAWHVSDPLGNSSKQRWVDWVTSLTLSPLRSCKQMKKGFQSMCNSWEMFS